MTPVYSLLGGLLDLMLPFMVRLLPIVRTIAPFAALISFLLVRALKIDLGKYHYIVLWIIGFSFFMSAARMTDSILLHQRRFNEVVAGSGVIYNKFGLTGLLAKNVLISAGIFLVAYWLRFTTKSGTLRESQKIFGWAGDFLIVLFFYIGLSDYLNNVIWLVLF
jgi:hypothetical protein